MNTLSNFSFLEGEKTDWRTYRQLETLRSLYGRKREKVQQKYRGNRASFPKLHKTFNKRRVKKIDNFLHGHFNLSLSFVHTQLKSWMVPLIDYFWNSTHCRSQIFPLFDHNEHSPWRTQYFYLKIPISTFSFFQKFPFLRELSLFDSNLSRLQNPIQLPITDELVFHTFIFIIL